MLRKEETRERWWRDKSIFSSAALMRQKHPCYLAIMLGIGLWITYIFIRHTSVLHHTCCSSLFDLWSTSASFSAGMLVGNDNILRMPEAFKLHFDALYLKWCVWFKPSAGTIFFLKSLSCIGNFFLFQALRTALRCCTSLEPYRDLAVIREVFPDFN